MCTMYINHPESILSATLDIGKETLHFLCERIIRLQLQIGAVNFFILTVNHLNTDGIQNVSSQTFREMYRQFHHTPKYSRKKNPRKLKNEEIHNEKKDNLNLEFLLEIKSLRYHYQVIKFTRFLHWSCGSK